MLASLRAELLILRKWPVCWALLLITPVLTLITGYLVPYLQFRTVTPDQYDQLGSPSQILPTILPGQYVISAMSNFGFSGTAPFVILGAVLAGGDWGRGTIKTALLQGPGRLASLAGQALGLLLGLVGSVVATVLLAGLASELVLHLAHAHASPADAAGPAMSVVLRALAAGVLVSACYGAAGLALGTLFRSIGGAIAAALLWTVVVQAVLDNLALQAGGILQTVNDVLPNASAVSVTSSFGALGGGSDSSQYYRVSPATSVWVLFGYLVLFLVIAGGLLRRRDIASERTGRRRLGRAVSERLLRRPEGSVSRPAGGFLAVLRSELLVMRRWPAVWAFVLVPPVYTLLNSYLVQYVFYRTAGSGVFSGLSADQILPTILPSQFVTVALNSFGYNTGVDGTAAFILLGALVAGNDWGRGTLQTSLLQGPGRLRTSLGQSLAVLVAIALSVLATLVLAGLASLVVALAHSGTLSPADSPWPAVTVLLRGLGGGLLLGATYGAAGLALGTLFRSAGAAIAAALLWSVILRSLLDNLAQQLPGSLRVLDHVLPNASTSTLTHLFGSASSIPGPPGVQIATTTACWLLAGYALLFLAIPAALTRWRDIR